MALAQLDPALFARLDQHFRQLVEVKRQEVHPVQLETFESNVQDLYRQMLLLS